MFEKISYDRLNSRQRENYNYNKLAGVLADYGYTTFRLSDDWGGADFIAVHVDGKSIRIQLKSRLGFAKKYLGRDLYVGFRHDSDFYLFPHDVLLEQFVKGLSKTDSWSMTGAYTYPKLSAALKRTLAPYRL